MPSKLRSSLWWTILLVERLSATPTNRRDEQYSERQTANNPRFLNSLDPNACTFSWHSTVVQGQSLWINNGDIEYNFNRTAGNYNGEPSYSIYQLDLSTSWTTTQGPKMLLNKTTQGGVPPRRECQSTLWNKNGNNLVVFGGELPGNANEKINDPEIYNWDGSNWSTLAITANDSIQLEPRGCGTYAQDDQGRGYYLGGYRNRRNDPNYDTNEPNSQPEIGMLAVNLEDNTSITLSTNNQSSLLKGAGTNIGGSLSFIGNYGKQGILVSIGGIARSSDELFTWFPTNNLDYNPMDMIGIYDIDGQRWYQQKTPSAATGQVGKRTQFCSVVISAPDNSSHHIYIYGGYNNEKHYESIFVLSLPLFHWTEVSASNIFINRFEMGCDVVGARQMLVTGGYMSKIDSENNQQQEAGQPCNKKLIFQVFDLTEHKWKDSYNASAAPYEVNADLVTLVGGTSMGGATVTSPEAGWTDPDLEAVFKTTRNSNSSSPSSGSTPTSGKKSHSSTGAIVGGVVGGLAGLAIIAGLAWYFLRQKKRTQSAELDSTDSSGGWNNRKYVGVPQPPAAPVFNQSPVEMYASGEGEMRSELYAPTKPYQDGPDIPAQELPAATGYGNAAELPAHHNAR